MGRAHGQLNTFIRLNKSFKKASMNIISDSNVYISGCPLQPLLPLPLPPHLPLPEGPGSKALEQG